jgi:hypothetical protein
MISHDHRFIFTHVPKTAGKSVRFLLGLPEFAHQYVPTGKDVEYGFGHNRLVDFNDKEYFSRYFKFAFVRNPYDRVVSAFSYLCSGGCNEIDRLFYEEYLRVYDNIFDAFAEDLPRLLATPHFAPQAVWLCDTCGALLTDFVGRYERLERDLIIIGNRLGLSFGKLPVLNASTHEPYRSYYDASTRQRIAFAYGEDLELFGYQFR